MAAVSLFGRFNITKILIRSLSSSCKTKKGLVLGAYTDSEDSIKLTEKAEIFSKSSEGKLEEYLKTAGVKQGKARLFYGLSNEHDVVAVVGIGNSNDDFDHNENINVKKENVRSAAAIGARSLQDVSCTKLYIEDFGDAEAAAEGATLSLWRYEEFKNPNKRKRAPEVECYNIEDTESWKRGLIRAESQNLSRRLSEAPANHMTPSIFCQIAKTVLEAVKVKVEVRDEEWAAEKKMGSFLSVTRGSAEPAKFLEMHYKGAGEDAPNYVFIGKGVTFDSGGISLKPSSKMEEMRADMSGAGIVVATMLALAKLQVPINLIGLAPLCENMPGSKATKPGDIVTAMNGKNIQVDNTDAEGRLILADALCYAAEFEPKATVDIATLTGAMRVAAGGVVSGVFTNSKTLWSQIETAGSCTGDRVWRFPLYKAYSKRMTDFDNVDVNNVGKGTGGGACTAAAFLKEFAPEGDWMHIDIAGVMTSDSDIPYLGKGMTGRPTRTIIQFFQQLAKSS